MKVKEVLKLSADLRKMDCREESKRLCEHLQLDMKRKVEDLSFGNRKKVGIVCFCSTGQVIVLDEPTGGLDPLMQKAFFDILEARNKEGATVFSCRAIFCRKFKPIVPMRRLFGMDALLPVTW